MCVSRVALWTLIAGREVAKWLNGLVPVAVNGRLPFFRNSQSTGVHGCVSSLQALTEGVRLELRDPFQLFQISCDLEDTNEKVAGEKLAGVTGIRVVCPRTLGDNLFHLIESRRSLAFASFL